jgi:hypothetical protein
MGQEFGKPDMPKFLDSHPFTGVTEERLKEARVFPPDEFGVDHINILYNQKENKCMVIIATLVYPSSSHPCPEPQEGLSP